MTRSRWGLGSHLMPYLFVGAKRTALVRACPDRYVSQEKRVAQPMVVPRLPSSQVIPAHFKSSYNLSSASSTKRACGDGQSLLLIPCMRLQPRLGLT